ASHPQECFTSNDIDPQRVIGGSMGMISSAGNFLALKEASRLLKLDEKRFDRMVPVIMDIAINERENVFTLAYRGFELGEPAVSNRLAEWAEGKLRDSVAITPHGLGNQWAVALVDRYRGVPTGPEWMSDPIVSNMEPELAASIHDGVYRLMFAAWDQHPI